MNEPHSLLRFAFSRHGTSVPVAAFRLGVFTRYVGVDVVMESLTVLGKWVDDHLQAAVREACRTLGGYYGDDYEEVEVFVVLQLQNDADAALARDEALHALYHLGAVLGRWLERPDRTCASELTNCIEAHPLLTGGLKLLDEDLLRSMNDREIVDFVNRLLQSLNGDRGTSALPPEVGEPGADSLPLKLKVLVNLLEEKIATIAWARDMAPPLANGPHPPNRFHWGDIDLELPSQQWRLLDYLWHCPHRLDKVTEVIQVVWGDPISDSTVRSTVSKLNKSIEKTGVLISIKNGNIVMRVPKCSQ